MLDVLAELMGVVPGACDSAEARHVERRSEVVSVRNGAVDQVETDESAGLGVRVWVAGAWGFAATSDVSAAGARAALHRALAVAEAQPCGVRPWAAALAGEPPAQGT